MEKNYWRDGLHTAEELYKLGFIYDGKDDLGCLIFKHPEGGSSGYCGLNSNFDRGMLDYVEHRKLNREIYNV